MARSSDARMDEKMREGTKRDINKRANKQETT